MDRRTLLKAGVAGAAFTAAPYFFTRPSMAQGKYKDEYKLSTVVGLPFPWGQGGDIWAKLVRERTEGRINIKMYPGVSLVNGDQTREFTAIRQGVIDLAVGSTINWSPQIKQLNLFSLPFLAQDHAGLDALVQGEVGKEIMQLVEKNGVVPLAWGENGFREVTNSKREIRTPADMKGLKFRVVGSPIFNDTFTALGANPTQMSWADAQPALASGAVEGQENPLHIFTAAKLHTLAQKYVTRWGYVADPLIFVANKDVWNSWTPKDRDIVRQAAIDAGKQEIAIARKGLTPDDQSLVKEVAALGVTVTELTEAEKNAFKQAVKPAYDKWAQQIGIDLVKKAEAAVAARKKA
ncbi:DctP family TRAP transporter solute-binding subunit [uncultured Ferrovibrio sp.]|jgi:tripartite ATP-independent transporter DctP family solute receptor|uniref:DctP family TRAP transporter solute-binding subunit n=1 Tax=uncultured Ferrovibrio sp. TaxID=1576913 RepID=UPI00261C0E00|nr:DctP family TRAP transporter solute-binding subunit [uncultured Ferrovibrio sp.]